MRLPSMKLRTSPLGLVAVVGTLLLRAAPIAIVGPTAACHYTQSGATSDHCYTFRVVHESCSGVRAVNWGCDGDREYQWTAKCVGWFDAYHAGPIGRCFKDRLKDEGSCSERKSLPPAGQNPTAALSRNSPRRIVSAIPQSAFPRGETNPPVDRMLVASILANPGPAGVSPRRKIQTPEYGW
jgi:hypothetical protein